LGVLPSKSRANSSSLSPPNHSRHASKDKESSSSSNKENKESKALKKERMEVEN
jgi:hypothetical protein